jgi:hypothetical protein
VWGEYHATALDSPQGHPRSNTWTPLIQLDRDGLRIAGWHDDRDRQVWFGTGQKVQICVASIQQGLIDESTPQSSVRAHSLNPRENVVAN